MSKASNLMSLHEANFNVPRFVLIPGRLFDDFRARLPEPLTAEALLHEPLSDSLAQQILDIAHPLLDSDLAIRSSMADEDSARHSFAGQLDSFLNIHGPDAVLAAVKACWASVYGERAAIYRRENNVSNDQIAMEVIVQVMVPAEISGVIFTADPVARDPRWMMISASAGLGEALVQGQVEGETVRVNRLDGEIQAVGEVLKRVHIQALRSVAEKIESWFGTFQDIEFAIVRDEIFILQARPITAPIFAEHMLWDNSNITESYSGVTTPLTFSVIRGSYANVYRQFLTLMGVKRMDESVLRNLLGFYNGQVYYQLLNWYQALSWLPAFDQNRRFMEQMMGVKQPLRAGSATQSGGRLALLMWGLRVIGLHRTSERRARDFLANFNSVLAEYQSKNFETMTPHQLRAAYLDLEARVLGEWRAPILTDFFAMVFFGTLRRLSERWLDPGGALHNDLLAGDGAIESIEPVRRVQALARHVLSNPILQKAFELEPGETLQRIRSGAEFAAFHAELDDYLFRYGDRCMNELKLEEANLRDDSTPLMQMIAGAVKSPAELKGKSSVRAEAEARVKTLPLFKRIVFRWTMQHARRYVRNRENLRFARSRLFGLLRSIFNALGGQWERAGVLAYAGDIYYLTVNEIWDFVEGTAVTQNLKGLVQLRRAEFAKHKANAAPLPDRFETFGVPYLDVPRDLLATSAADENTLQGTGCCSGTVRGRVRVVRSVDGINDLAGDILAAERTDPGWVFLYPSAAGILVERGSPLSHSAIVAREMGKPIVVNIPHLTARIRTGDEVEMDGARGTVRFIS
ncbi:MAG TPA: PEP/pyruvate-binding domain-containing protein [Anaerolineales bacterium]|nr:PEP/pyruvate-binding domain-containing protein [Anaerolineales bacterium]